jgi:apolipoprotein N-acyltransferase
VSAIIGERGQVVAAAPEYQATVLRGKAQPRSGSTPYLRAGNVPVLLAAALALLLQAWPQLARRRRHGATT